MKLFLHFAIWRALVVLASNVFSEASPVPSLILDHPTRVNVVRFSPDGTKILTGSDDDTARLWDSTTGNLLVSQSGHLGPITDAAFSPIEDVALTVSSSGKAILWRFDGQIISEPKFTSGLYSCGFSPTGKILVGTGGMGLFGQKPVIYIYPPERGNPELTIDPNQPGSYVSLAYSPTDEKLLATFHLWWVPGGESQLLDARTGRVVHALDSWDVNSVAFSPDGKLALTAGGNEARLWDISSGQKVRTFAGHENVVNSAGFSSDGQFVVTGSSDKTARLWMVGSDVAATKFEGHSDAVNSVAISANSHLLATASSDKTVRIWRVPEQNPLKSLTVVAPVTGAFRVTGTENNECANVERLWTFCQHQTGYHRKLGGVGGADDTYAWDMNLITDNDVGKTVYAVAPGRVVSWAGRPPGVVSGAVLIEHSSGPVGKWWSGYLHMDNVNFTEGDAVTIDSPLGTISNICDGCNGQAIPNHLHFAAYYGENKEGELVSADVSFIPRVTTIDDAFAGVWEGTGKETDGQQWPMVVTVHRGLPGQVCGTIAYPTLACGGELVLVETTGSSITLREQVTYGSCVNNGRITLARTSDGLKYEWRSEAGALEATGSLTRTAEPEMGVVSGFAGVWLGEGKQASTGSQWSILYSVINTVKTGVVGTYAYPSLRCGGLLRLVRTETGRMELHEELIFGGTRCVGGGTVFLDYKSPRLLDYSWHQPSGVKDGTGFLGRLGAGQSMGSIRGIVKDENGSALGGVLVKLLSNGRQLAAALTPLSGRFDFPEMPAGAYEVWMEKAGYFSAAQAVSLISDAALIITMERLAEIPSPDIISRLPQLEGLTAPGLQGSRLLVFDGENFVSPTAELVDQSKMSIVLTHGWIVEGQPGGISEWPLKFAERLHVRLNSSRKNVNLFGWDWKNAATRPFLKGPPEHETHRQGEGLGEALVTALGGSHSEGVHFIGHSLGALVNAAAANFVHGDKVAEEEAANEANPAWDPSRTHVTLFDEAEIARVVSPEVWDSLIEDVKADLLRRALNPLDSKTLVSAFSDALYVYARQVFNGRKPVLPQRYFWADNYISFIGFESKGSLTVCLNQSLLQQIRSMGSVEELFTKVIGAHSYSWDWYLSTVGLSAGIGFPQSEENKFIHSTSTFPDTSLLGTFWNQNPDSFNPLELQRNAIGDVQFPCNCFGGIIGLPISRVYKLYADSLQTGVYATVDVQVELVEETIDRLTDTSTAALNFAGEMAKVGAQKVIDLRPVKWIRAKLTTGLDSLKPQMAAAFSDTPGSSSITRFVSLPIAVPLNAKLMQFDYSITGEGKEDYLLFGVNSSNRVTLETKYIARGTNHSSQPFGVSSLAGTTNRFHFALAGGTSTNCSLTVERIRFYSVEFPELSIKADGGTGVLSWPSWAYDWDLYATTSLSQPQTWTRTGELAHLADNIYSVTNSGSAKTMFFRLQQSNIE